MPSQIISLACPGCGAPATTSDINCRYCHRPIVISTFNSVYSMPIAEVNKYASAYGNALTESPDNQNLNTSIAMCYLKLKMYDKALIAFERTMEGNVDNSEVYFYSAVCLLRGKKAFLTPREDVEKAIEYINAAIMIEPRGVYYYFGAYVKYDFYERKFLNTVPSYMDYLQDAVKKPPSKQDVSFLFSILAVSDPFVNLPM